MTEPNEFKLARDLIRKERLDTPRKNALFILFTRAMMAARMSSNPPTAIGDVIGSLIMMGMTEEEFGETVTTHNLITGQYMMEQEEAQS